MEREYEWHGVTFTVDAYTESGPGLDPTDVQIDIIKHEITDRDELSLWWLGIPKSDEDWHYIYRLARADIAQWAQDDYDTDQSERSDDEYEARRYY